MCAPYERGKELFLHGTQADLGPVKNISFIHWALPLLIITHTHTHPHTRTESSTRGTLSSVELSRSGTPITNHLVDSGRIYNSFHPLNFLAMFSHSNQKQNRLHNLWWKGREERPHTQALVLGHSERHALAPARLLRRMQ